MRNYIELSKPSNTGLIVMSPAGPWRIFIGLSIRVFLPILLTSQFAFCQQPEGGLSPNGQALFLQRCAKCHGEKGEGISALINVLGPSLQAEHDPGMVMAAMEVGPGHMPSFVYALSVADMRAVADYVTQRLAVIPLTGGNLSEGGELFRANCAPCHRTAVRGGALAFTGVNAPALTEKSAAIIAGAIRWGPGPMPAFPASVLNDRQLASVVQYVRFVQHPPNPGGNPIGYFGPVAEGLAGWVAVFFLVGVVMWIERGGVG
ncbi:MAG TPA: c-type cytochrome [Bryobacteraceae bacterium]|nr:c-type cytochrome [Bryobacteraceae bacterium]